MLSSELALGYSASEVKSTEHSGRSGNSRASSVAAALTAEGPLSRALSGYAPRAGQQALAEAIEGALGRPGTLVAEAGTGIGKTFAYLVPILLGSGSAIVSTGTRTLQDQLFKRDLPRLLEALDRHPRIALLKGRSNYLCLHRFDAARQSGEVRAPALLARLEQLRDWADRTTTGELAEVALRDDSPLRPLISSSVDNCLGGDCPRYADCYLVKARRKAQDADLVVVNHHLLFADLALKQEGFGELLPAVGTVVVDEAHQVPEVASRFFGATLSSRQLIDLARDARLEAGAVSGALVLVKDPGAELETGVAKLRLAIDRYPQRGSWESVRVAPAVEEALAALDEALGKLEPVLKELADRSAGLESCWVRARARQRDLAGMTAREPDGVVRWYETSGKSFMLHLTPLSVAEAMNELRDGIAPSWIFTSATLSVGGRFDLFVRQLGIEDAATVSISSPFDYQENALLYHPTGIPQPSDPDFVPRMMDAVLPVLDCSGGRAFLLFTSHRNLNRAAEILKRRTELPLFIQGHMPRHRLLKAFRESGNGVLLGAASFWQGVDVIGAALSLVVIDKLPFAPPDDPLLEARLKQIRDSGGNPFVDYQLPAAVLALKQGVGRLIRHDADRGVLVLCDPRLETKPYGRIFRASLPAMPYSRELRDVARFFDRPHVA